MKEDEEHRKQKASHFRRVMQAVGQISKLRCAANLDRKRKTQGKDLLKNYFIPNSLFLIIFLDVVLVYNGFCSTFAC